MNGYEIDLHKPSLVKRHESRIQELRYERKLEGLRLGVLKQALRAKLQTTRKESHQVEAA